MTNRIALIVCDVTPNAFGGGDRYHYLIAKGLLELEYKTRVIFLHEGKKVAKTTLGDITVGFDGPFTDASASNIVKRIRQITTAIFGRKSMVEVTEYNCRFCSSVLESIAKHDPDIIVVSHLRVGYVIPEIRNHYPDKKIIFADHNCETDVRRLYRKQGKFIERFLAARDSKKLQKYEANCIKHSDSVIVLSHRDKKLIEELFEPNALFCLSPIIEKSLIDKVGFNLCGNDKKRILHTGTLDYRAKSFNLEWFVEKVFPLVLDKHPDVQFDLIGKGASRRLRRLADKNSSVNLLGWVDDLVPYYKNASVYILPTLIGGGFELKVLQASAMGCPIVGTDIPIESIGFKSGTHCLMAKDASHFAASIVKLLEDRELAATLANNAYAFVQQEYKCDKFVDLLRSCVQDIA